MTKNELALAAKSPTFADLCDQIRSARRAHYRALQACAAADRAAKATAETRAEAEKALYLFIDRETAVDD